MEEDAVVKAPVTRLRRRLSVEQSEESKSPSVNTPTKRRGRKKPELELIDENTPENTTRKTKKTTIKDVIDPVEDKPVTPSRRSTRIKSNTSIVSETAVAVGSPRAKRATRRASQVGSDNEAPITPVRTTRRTRKDSASSIEKLDQPNVKPSIQIKEVIVEESETTSNKTPKSDKDNKQNQTPESSRKSPRLMKKQNQSIEKTDHVITDESNSSREITTPENNEVHKKPTSELNMLDIDQDISEEQKTQKDRLSISSSNLIKGLDSEGKRKKNKINLNKSTPLAVVQDDVKTKRNRTKSWTTVSETNDNVFFSDNEISKKKIKSSLMLNNSVSGNNQNITSDENKSKKKKISNSFIVENINKSLNVENNKSKDVSEMETDIHNYPNTKSGNENVNGNTSSLFEKEPSGNIKTVVVIEDSDSNSAKANVEDTNDSGDQCVPVIEHPDTLGINQFTAITDSNIILNKSKNRTITNNSCEPMDVDETMPDSLVIAETETNDQETNRISLISNEKDLNISNNHNFNKSKNNFPLSINLDKSVNENKSTPISSDLKETSFGSPNIVNKLLSKSAVDLDIIQENESNKKNISLNYLTSTPVQQKTIEKLVMQINTSIIASNKKNMHEVDNIQSTPEIQEKSDLSDKENDTLSKVLDDKVDVSAANESIKEKSKKVHQKKTSLSRKQTNINELNESDESDEDIPMKKSNKMMAKRSKASNKISSITSNDSDEESDPDNESRETNILDDEAEDMGDDYESGDSRDESERQFEDENEILEKGETLTSENELSNDSDYEKGSFIVSSDDEDNELLEGTEDDLSMSDNELKMTSKSKEKYDERKLKEQKMASREMYESRHKINQKSDKVKKNKRQKLSSSESESSESEKESVKPKKNNRMRLDSSHEASFVENDSDKSISKKKTSRLSESVCADDANEKEITIINESIDKKYPLSQIKEEPKTPNRSANSTIFFIDSGNTNTDKNESTKTQTELMDPLEDSDDDDDDDDVSLCSENEDIMQNYDSILDELNKSNKIKNKTCDISLNLDRKSKKKAKTPIVDELNLTQVKSSKKTKPKSDAEVIKAQKEEKASKDSGESSDSIDIHLLFSEDSNESDDIKNKKEKSNAEDNFIPLKRTEAKSNIREDEDLNLSLNRSAKKNKSRISQIDKITSSDAIEDNNLSFFIDTEGAHSETPNKSQNKSLRNNRSINDSNTDDCDETPMQEKLSVKKLKTEVEDEKALSTNKSLIKTPGSSKKVTPTIAEKSVVAENSDSDSPVEVSFKKEKRQPQLQDIEVEKVDTDFVINQSLNKSLVKTPGSEKKKKSNKNNLEDIGNVNTSANISLIKTPKSCRKSFDQDIEQIENADNVTFIEKSFNKSICQTPASEKKKKSISHVNDEEIDVPEIAMNTSIDKRKKRNSTNENKTLHEKSTEEVSNKSFIKTPNSEKKSKLSKSHLEDNNELSPDLSFNKSITKTPNTDKKEMISNTKSDQPQESILNVSKIETPGSKKKNIAELEDNPQNNETNSKKRKRKLSGNSAVGVTVVEGGEINLLNESIVINQKKKRKISQQNSTEVTKNIDKKENLMIGSNKQIVDIPKRQKSKKRKERDDEEDNRVTNVLKHNYCEKTSVSRLPQGLLKQLDDKPHIKNQEPKTKKPKLISTTEFIVEETKKRKAKPSNYLEESVYLDDDECERKKPKGSILNPKVLPFVPTASISNSGYTTNFKVNIVPKETKFVAQSNSISNFKDDYLYNKKIKRQGTYELYKRNRNLKISKF